MLLAVPGGLLTERACLCGWGLVVLQAQQNQQMHGRLLILHTALQEERERGYFDEAGNYVEREDKDEAELAQDAWLQSDEGAWVVCRRQCCAQRSCDMLPARCRAGQPSGGLIGRSLPRLCPHPAVVSDEPARVACIACHSNASPLPPCCPCASPAPLLCLCSHLSAAKVVSDEVRRKIEERQRREAAAEAAGPLSATQIARLQFTASQLLQPGETVAAGLKRLGGHSRRPAKRSKRGGEVADMAADVAPDPEAKEQVGLAESRLCGGRLRGLGQLACLLRRLPCRLICTCAVRMRGCATFHSSLPGPRPPRPARLLDPRLRAPSFTLSACLAAWHSSTSCHLSLCLPFCLAQFNKLTEVAMQLMDAGEADVYSQNKVGGLGWMLGGGGWMLVAGGGRHCSARRQPTSAHPAGLHTHCTRTATTSQHSAAAVMLD